MGESGSAKCGCAVWGWYDSLCQVPKSLFEPLERGL